MSKIVENTVNRFNRIGRERSAKALKSIEKKAQSEKSISESDLIRMCTFRCLLNKGPTPR